MHTYAQNLYAHAHAHVRGHARAHAHACVHAYVCVHANTHAHAYVQTHQVRMCSLAMVQAFAGVVYHQNVFSCYGTGSCKRSQNVFSCYGAGSWRRRASGVAPIAL